MTRYADDHYPARVDTKTDDIIHIYIYIYIYIYIALRCMYKSRQYPSSARATRRKIQSYAAAAAAAVRLLDDAYIYIGICIRVKKNRGRYRNCIQLSDTFITINSNRNDCVRKQCRLRSRWQRLFYSVQLIKLESCTHNVSRRSTAKFMYKNPRHSYTIILVKLLKRPFTSSAERTAAVVVVVVVNSVYGATTESMFCGNSKKKISYSLQRRQQRSAILMLDRSAARVCIFRAFVIRSARVHQRTAIYNALRSFRRFCVGWPKIEPQIGTNRSEGIEIASMGTSSTTTRASSSSSSTAECRQLTRCRERGKQETHCPHLERAIGCEGDAAGAAAGAAAAAESALPQPEAERRHLLLFFASRPFRRVRRAVHHYQRTSAVRHMAPGAPRFFVYRTCVCVFVRARDCPRAIFPLLLLLLLSFHARPPAGYLCVSVYTCVRLCACSKHSRGPAERKKVRCATKRTWSTVFFSSTRAGTTTVPD
ncbi:unnamed protein product [Trichogramma brassicae]|uniref:Uncharacterized protein n=1 Tax=Trichogramma brassicae TaxID=86971 RepID=A0A6H5I4Z9_9HYME|nr:unnamed protein product [Trichogramma brassicae]